jgi:hypothetical protein
VHPVPRSIQDGTTIHRFLQHLATVLWHFRAVRAMNGAGSTLLALTPVAVYN